MNKLDDLSVEQAAWIRKCIYRCAYLIWPIFAAIAVLNAINKSASLDALYWLVFAFIFAKLLHFISQQSNKPNTYVLYELLVAAFFQGALIGVVDIQVIPSLAILTPIVAFAFVGGWLYFLISLASCFLGFVLYFFFVGVSLYVVSDFDLNIVSIVAIIIFQVVFTMVALINYGTFESEPDLQDSHEFIDKATGLKSAHYLDYVLDNKRFDFLTRDQLKANEKVDISLFLIRIDKLSQFSEVRTQDIMNKQVAEFSYDLFYLISSSDLLIRWQEDQLLLISEKKADISTEQRAQSLVTSMHSHPIKGAELTPSIFCTDLHFIPSRTQKNDWFDKIKLCQVAMFKQARVSSWQFVGDTSSKSENIS